MPSEPPVSRSGWSVHTSDVLYRRWFWHAWGPRGHQSGAERDAETAAHKAHAASVVLADPEREKR